MKTVFLQSVSSRFLPALLVLTVAAHCSGEELPKVHSQPSWTVETPEVSLSITQRGGHMAPVTFLRNTANPVQPYYISPWQDEPASEMPAEVLVMLRGDFFCVPFGDNSIPVNGEHHPAHGESATSPWILKKNRNEGTVHSLELELETKARPGRIEKTLALIDGENVIYSRNVIHGFAGKTPVAHHATLAMPEKEGSVRIATSPIRFGLTFPGVFSNPREKEYQALLPGAKWTSLQHVPMAWKETKDADLSRMPGPFGYADLVQLVNDPAKNPNDPAWVTATFPDQHCIWFSLKDPKVLNSTVFWMENHGRHGHPWNGRNNCLGLEDVTSFFSAGLAASTQENALSKDGVATTVDLQQDHPFAIQYIQGVVAIPAGFSQVDHLEFGNNLVTFVSDAGQRISTPVHYSFLKSGTLP